MGIRNHMASAAILATLTACQPAPAHADVLLDPASVPLDPARPNWRPADSRPGFPAGVDPAGSHRGSHADDAGSSREPSAFDVYGRWQGAATGALSSPVASPVVRPCQPVPAAVPGPLPLAGVAAAFAYSRKLRQRINGTYC
jgi:hypothetical protein